MPLQILGLIAIAGLVVLLVVMRKKDQQATKRTRSTGSRI